MKNNPIYLEQKSFSQALSNFGGNVDAFLKSPQFVRQLEDLAKLRDADLVKAKKAVIDFQEAQMEIIRESDADFNSLGVEYINEIKRLEDQIAIINRQMDRINEAIDKLKNRN